MEQLLGTNTKLIKRASGFAFVSKGLTLAPNTQSGFDVCPAATSGCVSACVLWFAGRRVTPVARAKAKRITRLFFEDRAAFDAQLDRELVNFERYAKRLKLKPLVRLNVASDLDWSLVAADYPDTLFYDYTKVRSRFESFLSGDLPPNWFLTFSRSERSSDELCRSYLERRGNVSVVFDVKKREPLPSEWLGFPVIDGDEHDWRIPQVDGRGVVVGLRVKGTNKAKAAARASGFAVSV